MNETPLSAFAATLQGTLAASDPCCKRLPAPEEPTRQGSRRRRLWELDGCAHCPVIGVCLPIGGLRKLFEKVGVVDIADDDYGVHCDAMGACKSRTPLADTLQREFDRRYALPMRQTDRIKTTAALAGWWEATSKGCDLPGAVWATITHPRCDADLQHRLLGEVHMLQHQVGSAERVERGRLETVLQELADGRRAVAELHDRLHRQVADHALRIADQQDALTSARAAIVRRDLTIALLRRELEQARPAATDANQASPSPDSGREQRDRIAELRRALMHARSELVQARRHRPHASLSTTMPSPGNDPSSRSLPESSSGPATSISKTSALPRARVLDERAVLCVGGRPASVPLYRRIVEQTGGRFIHHDGGDQQNVARLDVILAAADLVICQTGCISHDAYWRVKDHCKRTGKPCVFVENPGSGSLRRALAGLRATDAS